MPINSLCSKLTAAQPGKCGNQIIWAVCPCSAFPSFPMNTTVCHDVSHLHWLRAYFSTACLPACRSEVHLNENLNQVTGKTENKTVSWVNGVENAAGFKITKEAGGRMSTTKEWVRRR